MKNTFLSLLVLAFFSAVAINSNATALTFSSAISQCDGGHECTDKCKKDKDGKCTEASADKKSCDKSKADCCKKGEKGHHDKKDKSSTKDKKESGDKS